MWKKNHLLRYIFFCNSKRNYFKELSSWIYFWINYQLLFTFYLFFFRIHYSSRRRASRHRQRHTVSLQVFRSLLCHSCQKSCIMHIFVKLQHSLLDLLHLTSFFPSSWSDYWFFYDFKPIFLLKSGKSWIGFNKFKFSSWNSKFKPKYTNFHALWRHK